MTNAINLLDGLDGLAGGVSIIVLTVFLVFAIMQSDYFSIVLCISLIAGTLGFLRYNFHPAKIFNWLRAV